MNTIYILNGPNLNLLGQREPEIYGHDTLADVEALCKKTAQGFGLSVKCFQSNSEGEMINFIHEARENGAGLIINAGAYTHTSVALHDALRTLNIPAVEVHLANLHKREEFRHKSFIAPVVQGSICGFGILGYELAIRALSASIRG